MKYYLSLILAVFISLSAGASDLPENDMEIYMLTVVPGDEIYSIYGHSALRVIIRSAGYDQVFNWGVFDFNTPNFGYKFVKGRLDYLLVTYPYSNFLREYFHEERSVYSQRVFLEPSEMDALWILLRENLKPENISYRYNFFYDNCATRIRDILYHAIEGEVIIEEEPEDMVPTFRNLLNIYQRHNLWLDLGIDFLLGMPADRKAYKNEQMFLPDYLMYNLSDAIVVRKSGESPLLGEAIMVLEIPREETSGKFLLLPGPVLWFLFAVVLIFSLLCRNKNIKRGADIILFTIYTIPAIILCFLAFFTEHEALTGNLNIIWCSLLFPVVLFMIISKGKNLLIYRITLAVIIVFLVLAPILPQGLNRFMVPVVLIPAARLWFLSSFRFLQYGSAANQMKN